MAAIGFSCPILHVIDNFLKSFMRIATLCRGIIKVAYPKQFPNIFWECNAINRVAPVRLSPWLIPFTCYCFSLGFSARFLPVKCRTWAGRSFCVLVSTASRTRLRPSGRPKRKVGKGGKPAGGAGKRWKREERRKTGPQLSPDRNRIVALSTSMLSPFIFVTGSGFPRLNGLQRARRRKGGAPIDFYFCFAISDSWRRLLEKVLPESHNSTQIRSKWKPKPENFPGNLSSFRCASLPFAEIKF